MTPDQQKKAERLERYIQREGLSSVMNNTKWQEAMDALQSIPGYHVRFRYKDVREPEPSSRWEGSFPHHRPPQYKPVEWFEVNPLVEHWQGALVAPIVEDFTEAITTVFQAKSIPFTNEGDAIRIYGYTRHNKLPI